jgi:hypothetical protein
MLNNEIIKTTKLYQLFQEQYTDEIIQHNFNNIFINKKCDKQIFCSILETKGNITCEINNIVNYIDALCYFQCCDIIISDFIETNINSVIENLEQLHNNKLVQITIKFVCANINSLNDEQLLQIIKYINLDYVNAYGNDKITDASIKHMNLTKLNACVNNNITFDACENMSKLKYLYGTDNISMEHSKYNMIKHKFNKLVISRDEYTITTNHRFSLSGMPKLQNIATSFLKTLNEIEKNDENDKYCNDLICFLKYEVKYNLLFLNDFVKKQFPHFVSLFIMAVFKMKKDLAYTIDDLLSQADCPMDKNQFERVERVCKYFSNKDLNLTKLDYFDALFTCFQNLIKLNYSSFIINISILFLIECTNDNTDNAKKIYYYCKNNNMIEKYCNFSNYDMFTVDFLRDSSYIKDSFPYNKKNYDDKLNAINCTCNNKLNLHFFCDYIFKIFVAKGNLIMAKWLFDISVENNMPFVIHHNDIYHHLANIYNYDEMYEWLNSIEQTKNISDKSNKTNKLNNFNEPNKQNIVENDDDDDDDDPNKKFHYNGILFPKNNETFLNHKKTYNELWY